MKALPYPGVHEHGLFPCANLPMGYQAVRNGMEGGGSSAVILVASPVGPTAGCARLLASERIFAVDHNAYRVHFTQDPAGADRSLKPATVTAEGGSGPDTILEPKSQPRATTQFPLRVLVVEDSGDVAVTLALLLKQLGHTVQVANTAQEALTQGATFRPALVFLDIGLPDLSGFDVCKQMRGSEWGEKTFIVALTAWNEPSDLVRSANAGFDRHIGKPMFFGTLQEILRAASPTPI